MPLRALWSQAVALRHTADMTCGHSAYVFYRNFSHVVSKKLPSQTKFGRPYGHCLYFKDQEELLKTSNPNRIIVVMPLRALWSQAVALRHTADVA